MLLRSFAIAITCAGMAHADVKDARFADPTTRYGHAILGDDIEYGTLEIDVSPRITGIANEAVLKHETRIFKLPLNHVFEDIAPRLWDVTGDGKPEVVVIETDVRQGAQLAIYNDKRKIAETPHIGRTNRWLAPIGAADMDGDGYIEIAYIDRPHLAKTLRVWRFKNGMLKPVADKAGLTNHRIGERDIAGGIRDCGDGPEMITASADWVYIIATRFDGETLASRRVGQHYSRTDFDKALKCN
ncbi:FG-GAP repeat domain-containing protein [Parasulfitobacter algicola]|uniref:VCBS repeat-containing protein n=1 Tax=Parasulfitobacter algicola TaxID=2614809 RepID=A0ABX2IR87_9RHOB|nr:VCBS repeat-containing protein [Sulfitobacter algicola]NSX55035.1 VCBS repeat-containing protein [Sulfitobacter algicola]